MYPRQIAKLLSRCIALVSATATRERLAASNRLLRFATRPWRYNGRRLWHATLSLASWGRFTHATARPER